MSGKVYSDAGTPSNATGENGDIFMQLDGLKTTYRKEGGAWTPIGNQLGTIPEFLKGIGVPSNAVGEDGQYYRDVNTDVIYEKSAGAWTNIGSWTSLETQQLLQSNGIGADLAVTNVILNIDAFIEAGAEGYFDSATTGTKPAATGLVKVWRSNATNIAQKAQVSDNKWATRFTADAGATWAAWRIAANEDGDAARRFKALAGTALDDVVNVGQLNIASPKALALFTVNPAGVATIERQLNIGSIVRNSVGNYTINFTTALTETPIVELTTIDQSTQGGYGSGGITRKQATWYTLGLYSITVNLRAVTTDNNGASVILYTDDAYISLIVY